ncbi:hypothetical protein D9M71_767510 [compost metagenome]
MTRMTRGLAWLATETVGEGEPRVVVDIGRFPDKKREPRTQGAAHFRVRRYPMGLKDARLAQLGHGPSQKGHHDQAIADISCGDRPGRLERSQQCDRLPGKLVYRAAFP